jgi:hypothetical protein
MKIDVEEFHLGLEPEDDEQVNKIGLLKCSNLFKLDIANLYGPVKLPMVLFYGPNPLLRPLEEYLSLCLMILSPIALLMDLPHLKTT